MLKSLLLSCYMLVAGVISAQQLLTTYTTSIDQKERKIQLSKKEEGKFDLYIHSYGLDDLYDDGGT